MHNVPYPFFEPQIPNNIYEEIRRLKQEIIIIKEKLNQLEKDNKKDYLKNDDSLYII